MLVSLPYLLFLTYWPPNINSISCFAIVIYTIFIFSFEVLFYFEIISKFLRMLFSPPYSLFITWWPPSIGFISYFSFMIYTIFILAFFNMIFVITTNNDNMHWAYWPLGSIYNFEFLETVPSVLSYFRTFQNFELIKVKTFNCALPCFLASYLHIQLHYWCVIIIHFPSFEQVATQFFLKTIPSCYHFQGSLQLFWRSVVSIEVQPFVIYYFMHMNLDMKRAWSHKMMLVRKVQRAFMVMTLFGWQ